MKKWARFLKRDREEEHKKINLAILSEVTWNDVKKPKTGERAPQNTKQTSLLDFLK
jgi:hypothetical protein